MNADGSHRRRLGRQTADGIPVLTFSPDGQQIAFPATSGNVLVMNAITGKVANKPLIPLANGTPVSLDWGPLAR
jgi:hypothetical protein